MGELLDFSLLTLLYLCRTICFDWLILTCSALPGAWAQSSGKVEEIFRVKVIFLAEGYVCQLIRQCDLYLCPLSALSVCVGELLVVF